jgi:hypothetical protein
MIYGTVEMLVEYGSVTFTKRKNIITRHYIDTDLNTQTELGKESTLITCNILTRNDDERILVESLLHGDQRAELRFHNFYYKDVATDGEFVTEPSDYIKAKWQTRARFIALDPIPYSVDTGGPLY